MGLQLSLNSYSLRSHTENIFLLGKVYPVLLRTDWSHYIEDFGISPGSESQDLLAEHISLPKEPLEKGEEEGTAGAQSKLQAIAQTDPHSRQSTAAQAHKGDLSPA